MTRRIIQTDNAPAAIGTYSQGVIAGGALYVSGQIPIDPATGELVQGAIEAQIRRVFDNVRAVVEAADCTLADAVKLTVYLTDLGNFGAVNQVMAEYFSAPYPARAALEVTGLPKGVAVEIDAIVVPSA